MSAWIHHFAGTRCFRPKTITRTGGDLEARFVVRINELFESYRMVREISIIYLKVSWGCSDAPTLPAGE
jgi:Ni,Fe-hydrogenase III large subunit